MAEASRSQVTITLGRSGQVVKRHGQNSSFSDSHSTPMVGSKRSVRERLGSNADSQSGRKRQRGDGDRLGLRASNGLDDLHLRKDDLRFKIMKKTQSGGQQNGTDLRELLLKSGRSSGTSLSPQERVPKSRNGRQRIPESKHLPPRDVRQHVDDPRSDGKQLMLETSNGRERMPEPRDGRQHMPESRDGRQRMPEPRDARPRVREPADVRQRLPDMNEGRQRVSEPTSTSMSGRVHSTRNAEALPQMDMMPGSYSSWTLDHIKRRSPDRVLDKSRGLSLERNPEEPQRRPVIRAYDDLRNPTYMSRMFMSCQGPVDDQPTVEGFLHLLGLEKYAITFQVEERGDGDRLGLRASNGLDDLHLRKDDLRFKIMKKTQSGGQQNGTDLRELLLKSGRSSGTSLSPQERVPKSRNGRQRIPESKHMPPRDVRQHVDDPRSDGKQRMLETSNGRERMPEPRDGRQHMPESRDGRQRMPEPRDARPRVREPADVRQRLPDMNEGRQRISEPTSTSMSGRVHSTRNAEALPQMDMMRGSYSSWTLDHIKRRSPDRVLDKSRGLSPERNPEEPQTSQL